MKRTNLYNIVCVFVVSIIAIIGLSSSTVPQSQVSFLSLDLMVRTLFDGKSITGQGTVYYDVGSGKMATRITSPYQQLVIANSIGEFLNYNADENSYSRSQGAEFSSKTSFFYSFLSGQVADLGLTSLGLKLTDTKMENDILVKTFTAPLDINSDVDKIELAFENYLPIYLGAYNADGSIKSKTYYTNYQNISYMKMPLTITEINFNPEGDSIITQRKYSNLKTNSQVDQTWLNFTIPEDAEYVDPIKALQLDEE